MDYTIPEFNLLVDGPHEAAISAEGGQDTFVGLAFGGSLVLRVVSNYLLADISCDRIFEQAAVVVLVYCLC